MKLNIKKSKIIVPALGLLLLSTAASVSGSVAWFTANRTFSTSVSSFTVVNTEGNLACAFGAGTGTKLVAQDVAGKDSAGNIVTVMTGDTVNNLGDASYDHDSGHLFTDNSDATNESGVNTTSFVDLGVDSGDNWKIANGAYYAVSWTMTFTYTYGAVNNNVDLYFDIPNSSFARTNSTSGDKHTESGFRIAFSTSAAKRVWADKETSANCHYVKYTGASSAPEYTATYASPILIDSANTLANATNGTANPSTRADYLGTFTTSANSIVVTCVAWFEGTDPNVVNSATMDTMSASMAFYTRTAA